MPFTAVETANGTLVANTVTTITFGSGSTPIRYGAVEITNESGTTTAPIYATVDGTTPTVGGQDDEQIAPNQTVILDNAEPYWTQGLMNVPAGTLITTIPQTVTPMGSSIAGGIASPGTTVKLISAQTMGYTVTGTG